MNLALTIWRRHRAWLIIGLTVVIVFCIRIHLRQMPMERDEGEYAYAGQLILQGVPPYKEAYNMKLPGTYAAYALIMAVFGQTGSAIHIGLAIVNAASIVFVFLIGSLILDEVAAVAAAICFALLSTSPSVLGLAAHATHFVVLPALIGTYVLLNCLGNPTNLQPSTFNLQLFLSGLLFGIAFLMKQHGIFFGIFGLVYLLWSSLGRSPDRKRRRTGANRENRERVTNYQSLITNLCLYTVGFILPYSLTVLINWLAGVLPHFWFWTVSYAREYAFGGTQALGSDFIRSVAEAVIGPSLLLWVLPVVGVIVMWWDQRGIADRGMRIAESGGERVKSKSEIPKGRFFLISFLLCSIGSVAIGLHFRNQYFLTLLPALSLLAGLAVSRASYVLKYERTIELFLAVPTLGLFGIGILASVIGNAQYWISMAPDEVVKDVYGTTLYAQARTIAQQIRTNTSPSSRIAVIGSEPEIYFLSHRRSATGYIYTYSLMEAQRYAAKMQREMIQEIERSKPEYVVYVNDDYSWLAGLNSERLIFDWWTGYWNSNLDLVRTMNIGSRDADTALNPNGEPKTLILLKRRAEPRPGQ